MNGTPTQGMGGGVTGVGCRVRAPRDVAVALAISSSGRLREGASIHRHRCQPMGVMPCTAAFAKEPVESSNKTVVQRQSERSRHRVARHASTHALGRRAKT